MDGKESSWMRNSGIWAPRSSCVNTMRLKVECQTFPLATQTLKGDRTKRDGQRRADEGWATSFGPDYLRALRATQKFCLHLAHTSSQWQPVCCTVEMVGQTDTLRLTGKKKKATKTSTTLASSRAKDEEKDKNGPD